MMKMKTILALVAASSLSQAATTGTLNFVSNTTLSAQTSGVISQTVDGYNVTATVSAFMPLATGTARMASSANGLGVYDSAATQFGDELGSHAGPGLEAQYGKAEFIDIVLNQGVILTGTTLFTAWGQAAVNMNFNIGTGTGAAFTSISNTLYATNAQPSLTTHPAYGTYTAIDGTTVQGIKFDAGQTLRIGGGEATTISDVPLRTLTFVVPEPSVALLGGLGALALLRRRRA